MCGAKHIELGSISSMRNENKCADFSFNPESVLTGKEYKPRGKYRKWEKADVTLFDLVEK